MKWLLHNDRWMIVLALLVVIGYGVWLYGWEPFVGPGLVP